MATRIGTPAALACEMASSVWGRTPSSAATTTMAMSVTLVPRARMALKACTAHRWDQVPLSATKESAATSSAWLCEEALTEAQEA